MISSGGGFWCRNSPERRPVKRTAPVPTAVCGMVGLPAVWAMSTRLLIFAKAASNPAPSTGAAGGWLHSAQETSQKNPAR